MSGQQLDFVPISTTPSLADVLNMHRKEMFLNLNCHHVATIQSFDPPTQTVTASLNYTKTFFQLNEVTGIYDPVQQTYPIILDCPIVIMGGGNASLTFPIMKGDECLILFNDRDIDTWFSGQNGKSPATARLHSFSDGFALIGVRSLARALSDYDDERAIIQNGTTKVAIGEDLIEISNANQNLNTILQSLITNIKALVTATAAITISGMGPPDNAANITEVSTSLSENADALEGLLQ
jgi:Phage protein Gp138 N-terminal domain